VTALRGVNWIRAWDDLDVFIVDVLGFFNETVLSQLAN